jgi:hypothetical protein
MLVLVRVGVASVMDKKWALLVHVELDGRFLTIGGPQPSRPAELGPCQRFFPTSFSQPSLTAANTPTATNAIRPFM